ncbi:transposase [Candidatus Microgenomates bacterium]|nr:transposase [Candidatus Microgenomates bacterium]
MATSPRYFETGGYYHIYNRGNRKQSIFFHYRDYERFLEKVVEYKKKYPLEILTYCLMPNHIHFLVKQIIDNSISRFMSDICNSHSRYINVKYDLVGSLFQGRFKAKRVEKDEYLIHLSRYIHLNPVELLYLGGDVFEKLLNYQWSSLAAYLLNKKDELVNKEVILEYFPSKDPVNDYREFVKANIKFQKDPFIEHLTFDG